MDRTVLAIDPGTAKCGMALVRRAGEEKVELLWNQVAKLEDVISAMKEAAAVRPFSMLIVGNGTGSKSLVTSIREHFPSIGVLLVDEQDTTMQARERYWEHHPRRGWRRLLPSSMQVPPEAVDDFVALILAERVLLA